MVGAYGSTGVFTCGNASAFTSWDSSSGTTMQVDLGRGAIIVNELGCSASCPNMSLL